MCTHQETHQRKYWFNILLLKMGMEIIIIIKKKFPAASRTKKRPSLKSPTWDYNTKEHGGSQQFSPFFLGKKLLGKKR